MRNIKISLIAVLFLFAIISGCSEKAQDPINSQAGIISDLPMSGVADGQLPESLYLGSWTMEFDLESETANLIPNRDLTTHYNLTHLLPAPVITLNSINPVAQTVDVDMDVSNPFAINGYDLRVIIFTDSFGHKLLNFDSWTSLYDIPGGLPINPFKAYAKGEPFRQFGALTRQTENLLIAIPGMNPSVQFAIEASHPGNCGEPYQIDNFSQGIIVDETGSSTEIEVIVRDWQFNTSAVYLYCPAITGGPLVTFSEVDLERWTAELTNNTNADVGNYNGYIVAYSSDSGSQAMYTEVSIHISQGGIPIDPRIVGECSTYGAMAIEVQGDYAYIADGWGGLKVVNIVNKDDPFVDRELDLSGLIVDVAVWSSHVYLVDSTNANLYTLIVEDIGPPILLDTYYTAGIASGLSVDWPYAYVANGYNSTYIFDIGDPENIDFLGAVPESDFSNHADAEGIIMIVADYESGIQIVNVEDREHPVIIDTIPTFRAYGVEIFRPYVYVADYSEGIKIVDVTDPYAAGLVHSVATLGRAVRCVAQDNYLYVADGDLVVIDITTPTSAEIIGSLDIPSNCNDVAVLGNYAYLATANGCVVVQLW